MHSKALYLDQKARGMIDVIIYDIVHHIILFCTSGETEELGEKVSG